MRKLNVYLKNILRVFFENEKWLAFSLSLPIVLLYLCFLWFKHFDFDYSVLFDLFIVALIGLLVSPFLFLPIHHLAICMLRTLDGGPFKVGDRARVLFGPHKDKIGLVQEVMISRARVRLDLGPELKEARGDIFREFRVEKV